MYSGAAVQNQLDANFASQETLTTLSGDTGGKAFLDTNDLGQVFDRVQRDTSVYYVLATPATTLCGTENIAASRSRSIARA